MAARAAAAGADPGHAGDQTSTHDYVQTGQLDSKFGFGLADRLAERAVERVRESAHLQLVGLHAHIGSQIFELEPYVKAIEVIADFATPSTSGPSYSTSEGLGIPYLDTDEPPEIDDYVEVKVAGVRAGPRPGPADPGRAGTLAGRERRRHRLPRRDGEGDPRSAHLRRC